MSNPDRNPSLEEQTGSIGKPIIRGEKLAPPTPKKTWGERLVDAMRKRVDVTEGGAVVVSNRYAESHVLLRVNDRSSGYTAMWSEVAAGHLIRGVVEVSEAGEIVDSDVRFYGVFYSSNPDHYASYGDTPPVEGAMGRKIFPELPYCLGGDYEDSFEVPLNTLVQIAEHGHVNDQLTQRARERLVS